jgi:hypothetical protein
VNVHAKSCLTPEPLRTLRSETKGQAGPAQTGRGPSPARCGDQSRGEEPRAINVQLARVTSGQSGAVADNEVGWSTGVTGDGLSNSQADSAGSIPVTRSTTKAQVRTTVREPGPCCFTVVTGRRHNHRHAEISADLNAPRSERQLAPPPYATARCRPIDGKSRLRMTVRNITHRGLRPRWPLLATQQRWRLSGARVAELTRI